MAKFTCPYCIREYNKKEIAFVCPDCGRASVPTSMELANHRVMCKTPGCGGVANVRACPKCMVQGGQLTEDAKESGTLPQGIIDSDGYLPFSIVGVSNSGKTNYITVMLEEFKNVKGLRLALSAQNNITGNHQNENRRRIYENHQLPDSTQAGEHTPQIWQIRNLAKRHGNTVPTYSFTIFDGAGEDHQNIDPNSTATRYISASKAIIITLDPLVLNSVRLGNIVDPEVRRNSLAGQAGDDQDGLQVINSVATYIKSALGVKLNKRLSMPVAVVLTKFDTVWNHPSFEHSLVKEMSTCVKGERIDKSEFVNVDGDIKEWLNQIGESSFINALDSEFSNYQCFGVSSYGAPPKNINTLNPVSPHRVLDPILWLFKHFRFVD